METIGVFFGSRSPEHDVSIITGELIIDGLKKCGYPVIPIYISKKGGWLIGEELGFLKFFTEHRDSADLKKFQKYYLDLETSNGKLVFKKKGIGTPAVTVDLAFPALHGSYGEDGAIQGIFEMLNVPYVGCDVPSSAIAMDKILTKLFFSSQGIPTTAFEYFTKDAWEKEKPELIYNIHDKLSFPLFVKPARLGSSIGITKVVDEKALVEAIEVALHYDIKALVEAAVENLMDVTCCLIGNDAPRASLLQESVFSSDLFNYEEKYLEEGGAQLGNAQNKIIIPARLNTETTENIRNTALTIYKKLGCSGIARVDFLYNKKTGEYSANEINPLPGTLYHHLWKKSGIELTDLLNQLIAYAKEKHAQKQKITYTFDSPILAQAKSIKLQKKI